MNYEQMYKEALERARSIRFGNPNSATANVVCEDIFPELKEDEDERLRKRLLSRLDYWAENGSDADREEISTEKAWLEKQGEQKPAWSEEGEIGLGDALWCCKQAASIAKDENDMSNLWYAEKWLKSIKDRVQSQPRWTEADEKKITELKVFISKCNGFNKANREKAFNMIDSLKPQNRWKPSDEQMEALRHCCGGWQDNADGRLESLYFDLQKL